MKRNEALNEIIKILSIPNSLDEIYFAELILQKLEEIGMQPPAYTSKHWNRADCDYHQVSEWQDD